MNYIILVLQEAVAMIHKLEYERKYESAMRHVFGKTLIARSMEVATQFARTQNLDCITLEGEILYICFWDMEGAQCAQNIKKWEKIKNSVENQHTDIT